MLSTGIQKSEALAYFSERNEEEIIHQPKIFQYETLKNGAQVDQRNCLVCFFAIKKECAIRDTLFKRIVCYFFSLRYCAYSISVLAVLSRLSISEMTSPSTSVHMVKTFPIV